MAFTPVSTNFGDVFENDNISHSITYKIVGDALADPPTVDLDCNVKITPLETNPSTISIVSGGLTATLSGYYSSSFDGASIMYRTKSGEFITVSAFDQIDRSLLSQIIKYNASTQRTKTFSYKAEAIHPITLQVIETATYTKTVKNNWDIGKNSLVTYVGYTQ